MTRTTRPELLKVCVDLEQVLVLMLDFHQLFVCLIQLQDKIQSKF